MYELNTVMALGFASTNPLQALAVALFLSLIMKKYADVWTFAGLALAADLLLSVASGALHAGGGAQGVASSLLALIGSLPQEAGAVAIRYVCLMLAVSFGFGARAALHSKFA